MNEDEQKIIDTLENSNLIKTNQILYWHLWFAIDDYNSEVKEK